MSDHIGIHQIGDVKVTLIREMEAGGIPAQALIPDWDSGAVEAYKEGLVPVCLDKALEHVTLNNHSWLIQTPLHTVLIDTGVGNGKDCAIPMFDQLNNPYLETLAAQGVQPDDVDYVVLTHLHVDHVGWNTRFVGGQWIPTFPNARYFLPRREHEHYAALLGTVGPGNPETAHYVDSVLPILLQAELIDPEGGELFDGLAYWSTPGHSIGHMSIKLQSEGEQAIFAGDVFHHPLQIFKPEWSSIYSEHKALGRKSRQAVLEYAASSGALVFTTHTPGPSAGHITREGQGFGWKFA